MRWSAALGICLLLIGLTPAAAQEGAELLAEKLRQLETLQAEIDELRRRTGTPAQVLIEVQILEVASEELAAVRRRTAHNKGGPPEGVETPAAFWPTDESLAEVLMGLKELRRRGVVKVLGEPSLVATDGRPATMISGGEFPVPVQPGKVEWRQFGLRLEAMPRLLGNGRVRLEVAPEVSFRDFNNALEIDGVTVPGLTTRRINTQVEMKLGETVAVGGLGSGVANRERTQGAETRTELLVLVTARLADAKTD